MKALVQDNLVIQVSDNTFEVHPSLFWMDAPEGCEYGWELVDGIPQAPSGPTDEELATKVRFERDNLLSQTDWIVIMHTEKGSNIPLEWEAYRQSLRDITDHANFPHLIHEDWPVKP